MKTHLLPREGNWYKANLHCHSCLSDGRLTPQEIKDAYRARGYSIVAFSDHDALHGHYDELTDPDFLALTAYEISIRSDDDVTPHALRKVVDLNLFARDPYHTVQVGYHPETVAWLIERGKMTQEEVDAIVYAGELRDMHYYPANINRIIASARENGYLVALNHPTWNLTNYTDYGCYEGLWGVEIYNHGCFAAGLPDAETVYDDILRSGKRLFCIATDDNHNGLPLDDPNSDSFGGFTVIRAGSLTYGDVIGAMEAGHFYASAGPEIYELSYEDGRVHIVTSPCADICMTTLGRKSFRAAAAEGSLITEAEFDIDPELFGAIRFRATDARGRKAWTNAYDVDAFMPGALRRRAIL